MFRRAGAGHDAAMSKDTYRERAEFYRQWAALAGSAHERQNRHQLAEHFERLAREEEERGKGGGSPTGG